MATAAVPFRVVVDTNHTELLGVMLGIKLEKRGGIGTFVMECDIINAARKSFAKGQDLLVVGNLVSPFK